MVFVRLYSILLGSTPATGMNIHTTTNTPVMRISRQQSPDAAALLVSPVAVQMNAIFKWEPSLTTALGHLREKSERPALCRKLTFTLFFDRAGTGNGPILRGRLPAHVSVAA